MSAMNGIATASKQRMTRTGGNNADACAADFVGRSQDQHSGCAGSIRFRGEIEEAVGVADAAIIVISGKNGVENGTRKAWAMCEKYHLPRIVYVSDMDIDDVSFKNVVLGLQELYGKCIAPFHFSAA